MTIFVSEDKITGNKIDYILEHYSHPCVIYVAPIISTILLITVIPRLSNLAYLRSIKFEKWKYDQKLEVDSKKLLTIEQSVELRKEMADVKSSFDTVLKDKDAEIEQLKLQMKISHDEENRTLNDSKRLLGEKQKLEKELTEIKKGTLKLNVISDEEVTQQLFNRFKSLDLLSEFKRSAVSIKKGNLQEDNQVINKSLELGLIKYGNKKSGVKKGYELTPKGELLLQKISIFSESNE